MTALNQQSERNFKNTARMLTTKKKNPKIYLQCAQDFKLSAKIIL